MSKKGVQIDEEQQLVKSCPVDLRPVAPRRRRSRYCSDRCRERMVQWRASGGQHV